MTTNGEKNWIMGKIENIQYICKSKIKANKLQLFTAYLICHTTTEKNTSHRSAQELRTAHQWGGAFSGD